MFHIKFFLGFGLGPFSSLIFQKAALSEAWLSLDKTRHVAEIASYAI